MSNAINVKTSVSRTSLQTLCFHVIDTFYTLDYIGFTVAKFIVLTSLVNNISYSFKIL